MSHDIMNEFMYARLLKTLEQTYNHSNKMEHNNSKRLLFPKSALQDTTGLKTSGLLHSKAHVQTIHIY